MARYVDNDEMLVSVSDRARSIGGAHDKHLEYHNDVNHSSTKPGALATFVVAARERVSLQCLYPVVSSAVSETL